MATLAKRLDCLRQRIETHEQREAGPLARLRADPARLLSEAGMAPDEWQADLLRSNWSRALLLCSRQSGKSQVASAVALKTAFFTPGSLTLLLSPTLRQSGELFRDKLLRLYDGLHRPIPAASETQLTLTLQNGSRIVSLPGEESGIRSYSGVALLVIDEAARVPDALYLSVRPMLATSRGKLLALSTPFGKRGWYHDCWHSDERWRRTRITADQCPRIPKDFLEEERKALGAAWFGQEYHCVWRDMIGAVFSQADIDAALSDEIKPFDFTRAHA